MLLAGPRVVEALHERLIRVQVDEQQVFPELAGPRHEPALGVEDDRVAVEDELVLAAREIAEEYVATVVGSPHAQHPFPGGALPPVVRGGRDVEEDARPAEGLLAGRATRVPDVLAHANPDEGGAQIEDGGVSTLPEVAILVEDTVVRQVALVVAVQYLAAGYQGAGVVQVGAQVNEARGGDH